MRKLEFITEEYYHIFNRGNNKRGIFFDKFDLSRFYLSMQEFNSENPIGSIYENRFNNTKSNQDSKLVEFICYCLNPNHYHFLVKQTVDDGVIKFMHRLGTGYTKYFNQKYDNSGSLFQGTYKAKHVNSNEYLLHLSAYINLNPEAHQLGSLASKSSWKEYTDPSSDKLCDTKIILSQFKNISEYKKFAQESLEIINKQKELQKQLLGS